MDRTVYGGHISAETPPICCHDMLCTSRRQLPVCPVVPSCIILCNTLVGWDLNQHHGPEQHVTDNVRASPFATYANPDDVAAAVLQLLCPLLLAQPPEGFIQGYRADEVVVLQHTPV